MTEIEGAELETTEAESRRLMQLFNAWESLSHKDDKKHIESDLYKEFAIKIVD